MNILVEIERDSNFKVTVFGAFIFRVPVSLKTDHINYDSHAKPKYIVFISALIFCNKTSLMNTFCAVVVPF